MLFYARLDHDLSYRQTTRLFGGTENNGRLPEYHATGNQDTTTILLRSLQRITKILQLFHIRRRDKLVKKSEHD